MKNKVVIITGSKQGIGKAMKQAFQKKGAIVCGIDLIEGEEFCGDLAKQKDLELFAKMIIDRYGKVDVLINNAPPTMLSFDASYDEYLNSIQTGLIAPFYLTKLLKDYFSEGASIINVASTRAFQSQKHGESYASCKGGLIALTHAMAISLAHKVRVNAISPGWIETSILSQDEQDIKQHPTNIIGDVDDIANMALYLASDKAKFITGQNFVIDGGMSKLMIYHNDEGWSYHE